MRRVLGAEHEIYIRLRMNYALSLRNADGASRDDVVEATTLLEELYLLNRRICGPTHPFTKHIQGNLETMRLDLASFDRKKIEA